MQHAILTTPVATQGERHAHMTIALHWLTAVLVGLLWLIGQTLDFAPRGAVRVDYLSVHMTLGILLGLVLIVRVVWRATKGGMLPPLDSGLMRAVANAVHWALYVLLFVTIGLGIVNAWAHGVSIYNLGRVPQLVPGDRNLMHQIADWHALAANTLVIVAGLHAAAALFHHYVLRDDTLRRMLPFHLR